MWPLLWWLMPSGTNVEGKHELHDALVGLRFPIQRTPILRNADRLHRRLVAIHNGRSGKGICNQGSLLPVVWAIIPTNGSNQKDS